MGDLKSEQTKETVSYSNQYDAKAKSIFSHKSIMAHVIKAIVPEFRDMDPMDIQEYFTFDELHGNRIFTSDSVSKFEGLKEIRSDLRFQMRNPKADGSISVRFEFDYEIQNKHNSGYSLHKRGIYYCARLLDKQLDGGGDYDSLQKVYSIWVITDAPTEKQGAIQTITLKDESGNTLPEFDLFSLNFIYLNIARDYKDNEKNLVNYLTAILKGDIKRLKGYFDKEQFVNEYSRKVDGRIKIQGRLSGKFGGKVNEIAACPILRRKTSMEGMTLKPPLWQVLKLGAP